MLWKRKKKEKRKVFRETVGGYPSGDKDVSELKPPPKGPGIGGVSPVLRNKS